MSKKLPRYEQELCDALDAHAAALNTTGRFEMGHKHHKYYVNLPDGSEVMMPVFKSPKGDSKSYGTILGASMRRLIMNNLERRKIV